MPPTSSRADLGSIKRSALLYQIRRVRRAVVRRGRDIDKQTHAPLNLTELKGYLEGSGIRWQVTGMFSLNARVGYVRAPHDLDIEIAHDDVPKILKAMPTWEHYYVDAGAWIRWRGRRPPPDIRRFISRPGPDQPWAVEWLATRLEGEEWVYRYDRSVRMPWMPVEGSRASRTARPRSRSCSRAATCERRTSPTSRLLLPASAPRAGSG